MEASNSRQPHGRGGALSSLDAAIDALDRSRNETSVKPVKDVFSSTRTLLDIIKVGSILAIAARLLADVRRTRWLIKPTASN